MQELRSIYIWRAQIFFKIQIPLTPSGPIKKFFWKSNRVWVNITIWFLSRFPVNKWTIPGCLKKLVGAMADTVSTCKNLSNSHIVYKWRLWGATWVTRELQSLRLIRYPPDMSKPVLKGFRYCTEYRYNILWALWHRWNLRNSGRSGLGKNLGLPWHDF